MKKWAIVTLVLVLAASTIPAFAQQSSDYITVKKSDLPPEVLKKVLEVLKEVLTVENPRPATGNTRQWFFLMSGAAGGFSTNVFVVAGPFKDQANCNELNAWAKKNYATVSRCWDSGN